jgi:hypothetical protein
MHTDPARTLHADTAREHGARSPARPAFRTGYDGSSSQAKARGRTSPESADREWRRRAQTPSTEGRTSDRPGPVRSSTGGAGPIPWAASTRSMSPRSVATSTKRILPSHRGQVSTSAAKTRRSSHAQGCRAGRSGRRVHPPPCAPDSSPSCRAGRGRAPRTTSGRALA